MSILIIFRDIQNPFSGHLMRIHLSRSPDSQFELPSSTPFFSWVLDTQWRVLMVLGATGKERDATR